MAVWDQIKIVLALLCLATMVRSGDYEPKLWYPLYFLFAPGRWETLRLSPLFPRQVAEFSPSFLRASKVAWEAGAHILMFLLF